MPRQLSRMGFSEYVLLAKTLLVVAAARAALHTLPFHKVSRMAADGAVFGLPTGSRSGMSASERARTVWAVNAVSRRIMPARRCLVRALSVQWLLRRAGEPAEVCIGARKSADGRLNAHAWVELDGQVIIGGKDSPRIYAPFQTEPARVDAVFTALSPSSEEGDLCRA